MAKLKKSRVGEGLKNLETFALEALTASEHIVMSGGTKWVRAVGDIARRLSPKKIIARDVIVSKDHPHPLALPPGEYVFLFDVWNGSGPFTLKVREAANRFRDSQPFPSDAGKDCSYVFVVQ